MLKKIPTFAIVLIIVFLITAVLSFIVIGQAVGLEKSGNQPQSSATSGQVTINIVNPNVEKEADDERGIK